MIIAPGTPTRERAVQEQAYKDAGFEDFTFTMPRPFRPEHFEHLIEELGIQAEGLANQVNQVFAENCGNNAATRIKTIVKFNDELEAAQAEGKRLDESLKPLLTQEDMDELIKEYDFSGVRVSSGEASASPFEREMWRLASALIRTLLRQNGFKGKKAPVTVARDPDKVGPQQIDKDTFLGLVEQVVEGTGNWGSEDPKHKAYVAKREELIEQAQANVAAVRLDADTASKSLTLTEEAA